MASSFVRIKEAVVVTPADPTPSRLLPLSAIDSQLFLRFTIEYLLIYRPRSAFDQIAISSRIKSAISKVLIPYYPLAGRVKQNSDGSGLEVVCRSQGALFIEAVSDYCSADFELAPRFVTEWRKLLSFSVDDVLDGSPPLVVQLTWLKDRGAAVGIGFNHCICDGIGSVDFLNAFAELASGGLTEFKPRPIWDRHVLTPQHRTSPTQTLPLPPEFNRVPDLSKFAARFSDEPLVPTSITFGKTNLNNLKNLAQPTAGIGIGIRPRPGGEFITFTSFEVLSAHIWRSWARSLKLHPNQIVKLLFSINVRKKIKPNLPAGYYGNAFVLGCAQTTAKELSEKGLSYAAALVKRAKDKVGDDHVRKVIEAVSESRASPDSVGVLILSQWSRLGLERVDFGLGRPVHVGPVCSDRYCIFLPVFNQTDAVKVMVAVPTSAVDEYQSLVRNAGT